MNKIPNTSLFVLCLLLLGNLFLSSCNKDKEDDETASIPLIATISSYDKDGILTLFESLLYDNQGRLIEIFDDYGSYTTYDYSAAAVTLKSYNDGKFDGTMYVELNDKGLCTSVTFKDFAYLESYEYDSKGYRKSSHSEDETSMYSISYTVSNANYATLLSEYKSKTTKSASLKMFDSLRLNNPASKSALENRLESVQEDYTVKTDFQYFNDKTNTIDYENRGLSFFGKQNKNPVKLRTEAVTFGDQVTQTYFYTSFTYEYDSKGRISKEILTGGDYWVYTYVD